SERAERDESIAHLEDRNAQRTQFWNTRNDERRCSIAHGVAQIVVTIEPFATKGNEDVSLLNLARIGGYAAYLRRSKGQLANCLIHQRRGDAIQCPESGAQARLPLPVISRTMSFSSK